MTEAHVLKFFVYAYVLLNKQDNIDVPNVPALISHLVVRHLALNLCWSKVLGFHSVGFVAPRACELAIVVDPSHLLTVLSVFDAPRKRVLGLSGQTQTCSCLGQFVG